MRKIFFSAVVMMVVAFASMNASLAQSQTNALIFNEADFLSLAPEIQDDIRHMVVFESELPGAVAYSQIEESRGDIQEQDFVKVWLAQHASVKIVPRSVFLSSSPEIQKEYQINQVLVLEGEELTYQDIINYDF